MVHMRYRETPWDFLHIGVCPHNTLESEHGYNLDVLSLLHHCPINITPLPLHKPCHPSPHPSCQDVISSNTPRTHLFPFFLYFFLLFPYISLLHPIPFIIVPYSCYRDWDCPNHNFRQHQSLLIKYLHDISCILAINMSKKFILVGSSSHIPLMDTKRDVFDLIFSIDFREFHQHVLLNQEESLLYVATIRSCVITAMISQTYVYPKFVFG